MPYCTIADLTAEGAIIDQAETARVNTIIALAGQYIELITRRWFEPRALTLRLDGKHHDTLFLPIPIISITSVTMGGTLVPMDLLTIYNRRWPDDRPVPKIVNRNNFYSGQQNVEVTGTFGYTDDDGLGQGGNITPAGIKRAAIMLVLREMPKLADKEAQEDKKRARIVSETTDRHSYTLSDLVGKGGDWTGDPAIDNLLWYYKAPSAVGSV